MRRRATWALLLLILGAITNVMVAWGCAYWGAWINLMPSGWGYHHLGKTSWGFIQDNGLGFQRVQLMQGFVFGSQPTVISKFDTLLPAWVIPEHSQSPETLWSLHVAAGWPLVSMGCQTKLMDARDDVSYQMDDAWQNAIRVRVRNPSRVMTS